MIAIVDGLAIQRELDPQHIDVSPATRLWEEMMRALFAGDEEQGAKEGQT
jgi:hypothetical protein